MNKKFNISEYAITKDGEVVQVSRILKNGQVLILHEKEEPDWEGSTSHLYERIEKGRNLMRFNRRNIEVQKTIGLKILKNLYDLSGTLLLQMKANGIFQPGVC